MEFVFKLLGDQSIIAVMQLLVGKWLKENPAVPNRVIPVLTFIAAVIGYTMLPTAASAASAVGAVVGPTTSVVMLALFQNLLVTGTHSTFKNTLFPALRVGLSFLAKLVTKGA